jgi:hypothetical protein
MIARSENEFEKFQQMDIERRRQEAALGADRKPRLIEESELPQFLLQVRFEGTKLIFLADYRLPFQSPNFNYSSLTQLEEIVFLNWVFVESFLLDEQRAPKTSVVKFWTKFWTKK